MENCIMADKTIETAIIAGELIVRCNGEEIVVNPANFSADIRNAAMLHGFKQKIIDAAALQKDDNGRSATPGQKMGAMRDVYAQLVDGDWNRRATGDGTAGMGLLVAALVRMTGQDRETVEATVEAWDKDQQAAVRASATVAPVIAQIKAERAAKKTTADKAPVDTGALLAKLVGPAPAAPVDPTPKRVKKAA